jgi:hypothetical protein
MSKVMTFLKKEIIEMLPPTIYALVVFSIVVFARSLMGSGSSFGMTTYAAALIGALVVGKSILIADALPVFRWFHRPMIMNVIWRILLYMGIILLFQMLEELIPLWSKYGSLMIAISHYNEEVNWFSFWATHLILLLFISFYCFSTALISVIGHERFIKVFLSSRSGNNES